MGPVIQALLMATYSLEFQTYIHKYVPSLPTSNGSDLYVTKITCERSWLGMEAINNIIMRLTTITPIAIN